MNRNALITLIVIFTLVGFFWYRSHKTTSCAKKPTHLETIILGTETEYPPFSFIKNDEIVGFDIDIAREVLKRIPINFKIRNMPFDALLPAIQLGTIHVIAAGMTPTKDRARIVNFSMPYFTGDPLVLISTANNDYRKIAPLKEKTIIVNEGFTADFFVSNIEGQNVLRLPTVSEAFLALQANRGDAYVTARSAVQAFFKKHGKENYSIVPLENTQEQYALMIGKKYPELLEKINKALKEMKEDGTIAQLKQKWELQ